MIRNFNITGKKFYFPLNFPINESKGKMRKEIFEDINRILYEEKGIADEVYSETSNIQLLIREKTPKEGNIDLPGFNFKGFQDLFPIELFGNKATLKITAYYPNNQKEFDFIKQNGWLDCTSNISFIGNRPDISIEVSLVVMSRKILSDTYYETVQHEVQHIYQQLRGEKRFPDTNFYMGVSQRLHTTKDPIENAVTFLMYMMEKYEQDAYANGLFRFIIEKFDNNNSIDSLFEQSDAYRKLEKMKKSYQMITDDSNKERVQEILDELTESIPKMPSIKYLGIEKNTNKYPSWMKFTRSAERSINDFEKKIARSLALAKFRLYKGMDVSEMKHYMTYALPQDLGFFSMGRGL